MWALGIKPGTSGRAASLLLIWSRLFRLVSIGIRLFRLVSIGIRLFRLGSVSGAVVRSWSCFSCPSSRSRFRAAGWSARFAGAGCPVHLPRWWRDWAAGPWGGAASAGRLAAPTFRGTELCLRVAQWPRQRRGPGCDHLGGCCPLPHRRGGISLKEAGTSLFPALRIGASCWVRERVWPTWLRRAA